MEQEYDSHDKENVPLGCLKLNNKIYPVFDGHNIIGRNPEARVNIRNLNISQQHAIITIIDEKTHFISDFKSSNGTVLDNKPLKPLKLYPLNNGASIKFADIFCTYKKLDGDERVSDNVEVSQFYNESFYSANTQTVELSNSREINLNELPTQVMIPSAVSINEMPTQVYNFDDSLVNRQQKSDSVEDCSSNESIDFMTMQKTTDSQGLRSKSYSEASTQELPISEGLSSQSVIGPVSLNQSRKIVSDCEEEQSPEGSKSEEKDDELLPSSQICPVRTGKSNVIDSDSETDEEALLNSKRNEGSKYHISDDDETDIEDGDTIEATLLNDSDFIPSTQQDVKKQETSQKSQSQGQSGSENFKLGLSESTDEQNNGQKQKTTTNLSAIAEDHIYCRSMGGETQENAISEIEKDLDKDEVNTISMKDSNFEQIENKINREVKKNCDSSNLLSSETNEDNQIVENCNNQLVSSKEEQKVELKEEKKEPTTQQIVLDFINQNANILKDSQNVDTKQSEIQQEARRGSDDIFGKEKDEIDSDEKVISTKKNEEDGEIYFQPTQQLSTNDTSKEDLSIDDDIYMQETQQTISNTNLAKNTISAEKDLHVLKPEKIQTAMPDDDDICTKDTQEIDSDGEIISTKKNEEVDDIYFQPTQQLVTNDTSKKKKSNNDEIMPQTQQTNSDTSSVINTSTLEEINDNFYLQPTQKLPTSDISEYCDLEFALEKSKTTVPEEHNFVIPSIPSTSKASKDDVLLPPSEFSQETNSPSKDSLEEHKFVVPSLPSTSKEATSKDKDLEDEDLLLPPTQALEFLHKDQVIPEKPKKLEDELEMLFASQKFAATQQLVDVLEAQNDIDDNVNVNITSADLINQKPRYSQDTIRKILDESITDDDGEQENLNDKNDEEERHVETPKPTTSKDVEDLDSEVPTRKKKSESDLAIDQEKGNTDNVKTERNLVNVPSEERVEEKVRKSSRKNNKLEEAKRVEETDNVVGEVSAQKKKSGKEKSSTDNVDERDLTNVSLEERVEKKDRKSSRKNNKLEEAKKVEETDNVISEVSVQKKSGKETNNIDNVKTKRNLVNVPSEEMIEEKVRKSSRKNNKVEETRKVEEIDKENQQVTRKRRGRARSADVELEEKLNVIDDKPISTRRNTRKETPKIEEPKKEDNSKRRKVEIDNFMETSPESSNSNNEDNSKIRQKREDAINSESVAGPSSINIVASRKRVLKTPQSDSEDEFEAKIPKTASPKKTVGRPPKKKAEPSVPPEIVQTPSTRKSARSRKIKVDDDVISVSSTSSLADEVISVSSGSTVSNEQTSKRQRRLSANSRAMKNEEEKSKHKETAEEIKPSRRTRKASLQNESVIASPSRNRRQLKPKVAFTMMDSPELESLIRQLGGSVVDTVDACTVLVTANVKRSHKLLCAVGQGKPICSPEWLQACKKAYSFVDPWDHLLVDKEAEKKWDFSLRESLRRGSERKLLENYTFQIMVTAAADVLKGAIEACGGKVVSRNLAKATTDNVMIVATKDAKNKFGKIVQQNPEIKVIEPEAVFDGTLRQELRFEQYLLT